MRESVCRFIISSCCCLLISPLHGVGGCLSAQGPTTAAIAGRILDENGRGLASAEVVVTRAATGLSMRATSRSDGRYLVAGLDVGGPYSVTARRIGSVMQTRKGFFLSLGQQLNVDVVLAQQPVTLEGVVTQAVRERTFSRAHQGTEALVSDSMIRQVPVINRDLYDLVRLVPQMSTIFPLTPTGAGTRTNGIRIDGIGDQVPSSNLAAGALYGGRVLPLDAVKEYQVLFSPFDVRQGGFAGAGVNVVTRSGTNELQGSLFGYGTNERLGADVPLVRSAPYEKEQFGFSLGGPVLRDRLLFFAATDFQRRLIPAAGPFVGEALSNQSALPVNPADITRFQNILSAHGLDGGSAGPVTNANPSTSVFLRLDAPLVKWNSRISVRGIYGSGDSAIFARPTMLAPTDCPTTACFPLSSLQHSRWLKKESIAAQLISNLANGAYNELLVGYLDIVSGFRPTVQQPLMLVDVVAPSGAPAVLQSGTHEIATGQRNANWTTEFTDNLSISVGAHRLTVGVSAQLFDLRAFQLRGSYGVWEFASLDSFQLGLASHYRVTRDTGSITAASGSNGAAYIGDDWEVSPRLSLTLGLRADRPALAAQPPYVAAIDSVFHLRTDRVPSGRLQWSPRFGFNYDLTSDGTAAQVRGGIGLFTGRPPLFFLFGGFAGYGLAARTLQCGSLATDAGPPPAFGTSYRDPPLTCGGGETFAAAANGEVDVIDPGLRYPQTLRASLAIDRQLPLGIIGTLEGLYTRTTSAMLFSAINLGPPVAADARGRVMYGTITASGLALPNRVSPAFGDVITITNQSRDYAYDLTSELRKQSRIADVAVGFSYGHQLDVQSSRPVSALLADDWRYGRPVAGLENDLTPTTSDFDQPFRARGSGTFHLPWPRFRTDVSFFYIGGSGMPYTYVAGGTQGRGDLNADGAVGNDPIYIPRTALDTAEIQFGGSPAEVAAQQVAFERFVDGASCLRRQRGQIMSRNSCRSPWVSQTNMAIRQALPSLHAHSFMLEIQIFNLLNMLNPHWGREQLPTGTMLTTTNQIPLLSQIGETAGGARSQPIYRFDPTMSRYSYDNFDTYFQIQLAVRYNF
ncbi:MAG TPA: TonB-dependent receptor [Gemmatimonadaceae bacterium]|nr:TonB-dependent receptor [Gemmatimonadaceae bacterium]